MERFGKYLSSINIKFFIEFCERLFQKLYNLTYIDPAIDKIISKENYEKFEIKQFCAV